ncbi:hypothetical protein Tco_0985454 [Tanacetum coccineum]
MSANDNFSLHDDEELSLHDDASLDGSVPASNKGDAPAKPPQIKISGELSLVALSTDDPLLDDYKKGEEEDCDYADFILCGGGMFKVILVKGEACGSLIHSLKDCFVISNREDCWDLDLMITKTSYAYMKSKLKHEGLNMIC